jgi:putative ABC transport system permease protein
MRSTLDSMQRSRDTYYASARFPNVFASLKRAPERVALRISEIEGVTAAETRVAADALVRVPGLPEAAVGHFISIPDDGQPLLSALYLRRGRFPEPRSSDEVMINQHFAEANKLVMGDTLSAVINGRWRQLTIVGVALSPEFVHDAVPSAGIGMFADSRHVGILWMRRKALAGLYDMSGAFNDVGVLIASGASEQHVIAELDRILEPYGGGHAYARKDQLSNVIVSNEIEQLRVFGTAMPVIFLMVAAFLLNIVLSRLVATQRGEIASLKAFGYRNSEIAVHFLGYPTAAVVLGSILGIALGIRAGSKYTALYASFFRFPTFAHHTSAGLIVVAVVVSGAAAFVGALSAVRSAVSLQPAQGMLPPAPTMYRRLFVEKLGIQGFFSPAARMVMRNIERKSLRAIASVIGVALAAAVLVVGTFAFDSARFMADMQFRHVEREDISVAFSSPRPARAAHELAHVAGVTQVEGYRSTPVRMRLRHRSRQIMMTGLEPGSELRRIVDRERRVFALPQSGIVLTSALAEILKARVGDTVTIEFLEKGHRVKQEVVAALADEMMGMSGYLNIHDLNHLLGEDHVISGAYLSVTPGMEASVIEKLGKMPSVGGTATRRAMLQSFDEQIASGLRLTVMIVVSLASVVALGVIYNGIRIALSERSRELASLRVLGFTRREVATLLFGEQGVIDVLGTPLGLLIGLGFAYWIAVGFKSELYRFPVVILPHTYLFAAVVIVIAAVGAGSMMKRRIYNPDLVSVLKTRE